MFGVYNGQTDKITKTGKAWKSVSINGERYSCWDKALFSVLAGLQMGSQVEFEALPNGDYQNLTAIRPASSTSTSAVVVAKSERVDASATATPASRSTLGLTADVKSSMVISYAKDLLVAGKCSNLEDGITIIYSGVRFLDRLMREEAENPTVPTVSVTPITPPPATK